jgi:DNA polymerase-3 subunit delta'
MFDALDIDEEGFDGFEEPEGLTSPRDSNYFVGHEAIEAQLLSLINTDNLPHALIFSGPHGIGKSTFAFRLARYLLKNGVGKSDDGGLFGDAAPLATSLGVSADDPIFKQVASGGHPDLLTIERPLDERKGTVKNNLDVDTARKVTPFLRKTASDGGWRVVIVDDADTMNRNAQNALLKILEEPPKNTLLILICHRLGHMIPTIRSRCRVVDFAPLSKDHLNDLMQKEIGGTLSLEEQEILAFLSEGSIGVAKIILDTNGIETAQNVFDILKRRPFDKSQIHQLANNVSKDDIFKNIERVFLKIIEAIVFSKAQNQPLEAPLSAMNFDGDLQDWLKKYEEMKTHFQQAHTGNLDKKLATLNAFFIFEN